ncbi:hypothetical protein IQ254_15780 [Nodosilinea sp. LEGE 07088]|uniref:hypothetical protein n=1 Tax=Nodosilinea sp. LEGE 07088 TaxID=2777968 RepID=UPI00187E40FF|nr:hypothetical protein [Nodosilinea sp. LEGE 07088]MBE9138634.1 hypothetical protein [Nodosilinea sp. LEGE 07088]
MSDIAIFKEMIKRTATVSLESYHNKHKVTLEEPAPANYSVTIYGMPDDDQVVVIKADAFKAPKDIFADSKRECKRADFVIVTEINGKQVIICIEMKGGRGGAEIEIIQQLKGAKCFVAYCREIGQSFWNHQNFLKDSVYRFVSIRNISISKRPTRPPGRTEIHNHPERMLKITSPRGLQFKRLVGDL